MLKGLLLGGFVGTALAAGAWFGFVRPRETPAPADEGAVAETPAPAPNPALDAAKLETSRLTAELASIPKAHASVESPVKPVAVSMRTKFKELGAKIYRLRDELKNHEGMTPEKSELMTDLLALLSESARLDGVSLEDAILGPDGMLGVLVGVLEGSDLAPDAAQQAKLDAVMTKAEKDWKDYLAGRGDLGAMEAQRDLLRLAGTGVHAMQAALNPEQFDMLDKLEMFKGAPSGRMSSSLNSSNRDSVKSYLTDRWKDDLKLDDTQAISIQPIVEEYMRGYDGIQAESARRKAAGEKEDEWSSAISEVDLMVSAEKRIRETLRLSDKQEEAVKAWNSRYGYTIEEEK